MKIKKKKIKEINKKIFGFKENEKKRSLKTTKKSIKKKKEKNKFNNKNKK